ncbi:ISL3 family transposase [Crocosphaera sp. Alani8]|uniref:ISL3 family transposase n=1 Tax=Crocosphaera sp. Alani8 TaxID=3038952 RepID=UPI00313E9D48
MCPHCQTYTDNLHQTRPILVRDLSIVEQGVYLKVQGLNNKIKLILRQSYGVKDFG